MFSNIFTSGFIIKHIELSEPMTNFSWWCYLWPICSIKQNVSVWIHYKQSEFITDISESGKCDLEIPEVSALKLGLQS